MKKIALLLSFSVLTVMLHATVNEKVLKAFQQMFPTIENPQWFEYDDGDVAYFDMGRVKCRIKYDFDGKMMSVRRDYYQESLCPFIRAAVQEKYPGKQIYGVTEITSSEEMTYYIILQDDKHWYHVHSDALGNVYMDKKLQKS